MTKSKGLNQDAQMSLGKQLGDGYNDILQKFPLRFHDLLRRVKVQAIRGRMAENSPLRAADSAGIAKSKSFDPETLIKLEAAFDEAWSTLKQIGNKSISREMLAQRLLELASEKKCNPDQLAARSITSLIRSQRRALRVP